MSVATPATDFISALDAPLRVIREDIRRWGPPMAVFSLTMAAVQIPGQFVVQAFSESIRRGDLPNPYSVALSLAIALPFLLILSILGYAAQFFCIADVTAGRPAGVWSSLRQTFSWSYAAAMIVHGLLGLLTAITCCVGGFLLLVPFAFIPAAAVDEGRGWNVAGRSIELAMLQTGPAWYDRPGWKVVALTAATLALSVGANAVVQLPMMVVMSWGTFQAISSGDLDRIQELGMVNPWLSTVTILLASGVQMFTTTYYLAGTFLIFRDARDRFEGRQLEAAIEGTTR